MVYTCGQKIPERDSVDGIYALITLGIMIEVAMEHPFIVTQR